MDELKHFLKTQTNLINLLILGIIMLSIPLGINLVKQRQIFFSKAADKFIEVASGKCVVERNGQKYLKCAEVPVRLVAPFGSNVTPLPDPSAKSSPSSSNPSPTSSPKASSKPKTSAPPYVFPAACNSATKTAEGKPILNAKNFSSIQAALDCFKDNASGGGAVYVPAGVYNVTEKIRLFSNVTFFGDGIDQTIFQLDSSLLADADGIIANDTNYGHNNITIRDMTFKGLFQESGLLNCCPGIKLRQLDGGLLYNIKVEGFSWHGIWLAYKKQTRESKDSVEHVRISHCQLLNNKGSGIEIDSPQSNNVVDNCTVSGNNHGTGGDKNGGGGISFFMDEDGLVTKNKVLNNVVSNNSNKGIIMVARNNITAIKTTRILNNAVCNNTVENNHGAGIADGNSEENKYYANKINNNGDNRDGRVSRGSQEFWDFSTLSTFNTPANSNLNMEEDESAGATSADCKIPDSMEPIPAAPSKPTSLKNPTNSLFVKNALAADSASTQVKTTDYRIAETEAKLASTPFVPFDQDPLVANLTLKDDTPGVKQVWVEFKSNDGQLKKDHINITLLEKEPLIDSVGCNLDNIQRQNIKVTLTGSRFGENKGKITSDGTALDVLEWKKDSITAIYKKPSLPTDDSKVFKIVVTRDDETPSLEAPCRIESSLVSLGARVFCREEGHFEVSDVKVTLLDSDNNKVEETVTIDKDGIVQGLKTKLQAGKQYVVSIKAPFSLRRNAIFTASVGTTVVTQADGEAFILPIGDIAPTNNPDGEINVGDKAVLTQQWISAISASKNLTADFNKDQHVNGFDWACMRYDFGKSDDPIPSIPTEEVAPE